MDTEFKIFMGVRNPWRCKIWCQNLRSLCLLFHVYPKEF